MTIPLPSARTVELTRPLAYFDLETTGVDIATDRIVEVAVLKLLPNGTEVTFESRINPSSASRQPQSRCLVLEHPAFRFSSLGSSWERGIVAPAALSAPDYHQARLRAWSLAERSNQPWFEHLDASSVTSQVRAM
jgi:hypothetical protein